MEPARAGPASAAMTGSPGAAGLAGPASDCQALAALGTARVDDGTAAAGLHAHEKPVGTGAANLGRLVGALHGFWALREFGKPTITSKNANPVKHLHHSRPHPAGLDGSAEVVDNRVPPVERDPCIGGSQKKMSTK
jgi:hypothetical protein